MFKHLKKYARLSRGQGMTEYIIIVALIAIAAISMITIFGQNLRALFGASANALAGNTSAASTASGAMGSRSAHRKSLSNFGTSRQDQE